MGEKNFIILFISLLISVFVIGYSFFETKQIKYYENNIHNGDGLEMMEKCDGK